MKLFRIIILGLLSLVMLACEELIEVDLNSADPKVVIVADLNNLGVGQEIQISRTVNFEDNKAFDPVEDAEVILSTNQGRNFRFVHNGNGRYIHSTMDINTQDTYFLNISIDGQSYTSTARMSKYVEIDSLGVTKEDIFNDTYYFVNLKFDDPAEVLNFYRYSVSVNGNPFKFSAVFSDKFNDGKQVTHQISGGEQENFNTSDEIIVRRNIVSKDVYTYWSEVQAANPGNAAPGNPTSNISNGALGYFSLSNAKDYSVVIQDTLE